MKVLIYSAKDFEIPFLEKANKDVAQIKYIPERLTLDTANLAIGFDVVSIFSADDGSSKVIERLKDFGVRYIALRSTGYDNVNLAFAKKLGIKVANAAGYSPRTIAEHAVALLLAINRKLILSDQQVQNYNFSLNHLIGFEIYNKTVGIIGMGRIGKAIAQIMNGFGSTLIANDLDEDEEIKTSYKVTYTGLENVCKQSDIIFLSVPLNSHTHHLIDKEVLQYMNKNTILVNVARGAVVHTQDILQALKNKEIAAYGTDVYEYENGVFFYDHSKTKLNDQLLEELISLPNVLITPHQAFATQEALTSIAEATFYNISCWSNKQSSKNELN